MPNAKDGDDKPSKKKKQPKKAAKKGASKKSKPKSALSAEAELAQPCLTLTKAAFIVGGCLPSGTHGPDDTLEDAGLISENLRLIFRECLFNGVLAAGCEIDRGQIPNDADTEIGDVVKAVFQNSR